MTDNEIIRASDEPTADPSSALEREFDIDRNFPDFDLPTEFVDLLIAAEDRNFTTLHRDLSIGFKILGRYCFRPENRHCLSILTQTLIDAPDEMRLAILAQLVSLKSLAVTDGVFNKDKNGMYMNPAIKKSSVILRNLVVANPLMRELISPEYLKQLWTVDPSLFQYLQGEPSPIAQPAYALEEALGNINFRANGVQFAAASLAEADL